MISLEWLGPVPGCDYQPSDHLLSLLYVVFLVMVVAVLSLKYKHLRDNYHEVVPQIDPSVKLYNHGEGPY